MRLFITVIAFFILVTDVSAQKSTSRSKAGSLVPPRPNQVTEQINKEKETPVNSTYSQSETGTSAEHIGAIYQTPFLVPRVTFSDPNSNNFLDAGETWVIHLNLVNTGKAIAEGCEPKLYREVYNPSLLVDYVPDPAQVAPGDSITLNIKIKAAMDVKTGKTPVRIAVVESRGFDLEPEIRLTIPTRAFQPPILEISDYYIQDQNRNNRIEKREVVDIIFRIRNKGETTAQSCTALVTPGLNVLPVEIPVEYQIGDLKPGDYKDITATIVTNTRTTEVIMSVTVSDGSGRYRSSQRYTMPFDVVQRNPEELTIETHEPLPVTVNEAGTPMLDIAVGLPDASSAKQFGVAVIIGNSRYDHAPDVDYALNDARIIKNYTRKVMGYSDQNTIMKENARQSDFFSLFGNETNFRGQVYNYSVKGQSELFIYYSGHGAPDPNSGQAFLVPVDCDPNSVALNGYPLSLLIGNLYKILEEKELKQITLVLEACFSGNSEAGSLLKNVSPVTIRLKDPQIPSEKMTIFSSSSGDQLSNWYPDMRQSLYTYFFLKGLKGEADLDKNHRITAEELHQFVADEVNGVPYWSKRLHQGRNQTPTLSGNRNVILFQ
jgi:hypothetical protein